MRLTEFEIDETPHSMDGLLLHARDASKRVEAFISRRVMDSWVDPREPYRKRRSLLRAQYNALRLSMSRRLGELRTARTSAGRRTTASIRLWIFCCPTSRKAQRHSIRANSCAKRRLRRSNGYRVRVIISSTLLLRRMPRSRETTATAN
jgi:hypothetical protein